MMACLVSNSSYSNTDLAMVACRRSSSNSSCTTGLATVACRGSSSRSSNGLAVVACRGSSSNSSNGLAAVGFLTSTNVGPMLSLPPGRRDNSNRWSNRHGESLRSEVTGGTEVTPYLKRFLAAMAGSGFGRKMWRCRCSLCWRDRSSWCRRQWHLLKQHLRLKRWPAPVSSPMCRRRVWRKRLRRPRARHRRQYLQQRRRPAVLFSPLRRWGGRPGRPLCR